MPNHKFKLQVKTLVGNEEVDKLGGAKIGIWIHTDQEEWDPADADTSAGMIWSYTPQGKWEMHSSRNLNKNYIINTLAHTFDFELKQRSFATSSDPGFDFHCVSAVKPIVSFRNHAVVPTYRESEFETLEVCFNTTNKRIRVPHTYYENEEQVHRTNQNYRIEVFILPNHSNKDRDWETHL